MFQALIKYSNKTKIPSINNMYKIGRNGNKVWMYLNPDVQEYKDHIRHSILKQGVADYFRDKTNICIELEILAVFSENFWVRDISNTVKATEDAFAETIKVDDRFNIRVCSRKLFNDKDNNEYLIITAKYSDKKSSENTWSHYAS